MPNLDEFYVSNPEGERIITAFVITHPQMSQTYYLVDDSENLTVTDPDIVGGVFNAEAISYSESVAEANLDKTATLGINDYTGVIDEELERIDFDTTSAISVTVNQYHNLDLSTPQKSTIFSVVKIAQTDGEVVMSLEKPRLNVNGTGDIMSYNRFPMQRGL